MFHRSHVAKSRRQRELQPAADHLFTKRPYQSSCVGQNLGRSASAVAPEAVLVAGQELPYRLTRLDELQLSRLDVPALTVTADPVNNVTVAGSERSDWSLRFCAQGNGESEHEARQELRRISMILSGSVVSLTAPHLLSTKHTPNGMGDLVVDAPLDANVVIHASCGVVRLQDMTASVHVAAPRGRATILDTIGHVEATAFAIDFSGWCGHVNLSAGSDINLKLSAQNFKGTVWARAQQSIRMLVPQGFVTPFRAVVGRREDFVCRTEFAALVSHEKKGELHYFTYAGANAAAANGHMLLHSEHATVVIDSISETSRSSG